MTPASRRRFWANSHAPDRRHSPSLDVNAMHTSDSNARLRAPTGQSSRRSFARAVLVAMRVAVIVAMFVPVFALGLLPGSASGDDWLPAAEVTEPAQGLPVISGAEFESEQPARPVTSPGAGHTSGPLWTDLPERSAVPEPIVPEPESNAFYSGTDCGDECGWGWQVLPQGIVYKPYLAAAKESRLSTVLMKESEDGLLWDSTLGGRFGLLRFGPSDRPEGFQWDIDGAGMVRLDPAENMDVRAADFRAGTSLNWGYSAHRWRVGYYHLSSHTGDEFLLKNPNHNRLNFYRDAFYVGYSYYVNPDFRVYAELAWAFHVEYAEPFEFLFGFDWAPSYATGLRGAPFAALNVHLRQELDFSGNLALQAGWAWRGADAASGLFRTGLYYYNGGSPQGSFYADNEQSVGYGIWYDF
jgi:hypothetical protein